MTEFTQTAEDKEGETAGRIRIKGQMIYIYEKNCSNPTAYMRLSTLIKRMKEAEEE